jgi:hypothetical protein
MARNAPGSGSKYKEYHVPAAGMPRWIVRVGTCLGRLTGSGRHWSAVAGPNIMAGNAEWHIATCLDPEGNVRAERGLAGTATKLAFPIQLIRAHFRTSTRSGTTSVSSSLQSALHRFTKQIHQRAKSCVEFRSSVGGFDANQ